jgi:hypothetical protein
MATVTMGLKDILDLVGVLDDIPGDHAPRERFREHLQGKVREVGQLRDYIEECLRTPGDQYSRALQDLVNRLGQFLGFSVTFGRYQGVHGQFGFDGHWVSPTGYHVVVEVKTSEVYAVRTAALLGYVDGLISEQRIPDREQALGLYVVGRPDPEIRTLEKTIVAEKRTQQLRVISAESLLSLAELIQEYDVTHEDILGILRPSSPLVDAVVDLLTRLVASPKPEGVPAPEAPPPTVTDVTSGGVPAAPPAPTPVSVPAYWLTPIKSDEKGSAEEVVRTLVGEHHLYAFGDRTPGRKHLKPGDGIAFYATGTGVIAHAQVASMPERKPHPSLRHPELYPWTFRLDNICLYPEAPVVIDAALRSRLEPFQGRDPNQPWAWFVQATRRISQHDFGVLVRR